MAIADPTRCKGKIGADMGGVPERDIVEHLPASVFVFLDGRFVTFASEEEERETAFKCGVWVEGVSCVPGYNIENDG